MRGAIRMERKSYRKCKKCRKKKVMVIEGKRTNVVLFDIHGTCAFCKDLEECDAGPVLEACRAAVGAVNNLASKFGVV